MGQVKINHHHRGEAERAMTARSTLRIGVVLEALLGWPLEQVMAWLGEHAPEVTELEIGAGGHAPHPHCDLAALLASGRDAIRLAAAESPPLRVCLVLRPGTCAFVPATAAIALEPA
jgi:hypothetical protein